jgi:hypothetical protein
MKLKTARWGFPCERLLVGPSDRDRYPVAAPWIGCPLLPRAALTDEKAGMHAHRSSRSYIAVQGLT